MVFYMVESGIEVVPNAWTILIVSPEHTAPPHHAPNFLNHLSFPTPIPLVCMMVHCYSHGCFIASISHAVVKKEIEDIVAYARQVSGFK